METIPNDVRNAPIQQTESTESIIPPAQTRTAPTDNSVGDHGTTQQTTGGSPSDGAREATTNRTPGYAEIEQLTEERLMLDPDYRKLKEQLDQCAGLEEMLLQIDSVGIWAPDRKICLDDIIALVNDVNQPNKSAREAAKWLNDHKQVWAAIAKDDNLASLDDVKAYIAGMKAEVKTMRDAARADIKAENAIPAAGASQSSATGTNQTPAAGQGGSAIMAEAAQELPKPAASQFSGLEGASENMNNMIGWGESEIDRLTSLMGKTDDPAALKQLENKINQMSRRMQQMTALMNQVMTAMQNISKMYSEITMNSVRNMR